MNDEPQMEVMVDSNNIPHDILKNLFKKMTETSKSIKSSGPVWPSNITPKLFDNDHGWIPIPDDYFENMSTNTEKTLTIMTWNVWFKDYHKKERSNEIFRIIENKLPDIVCLQEVTADFLQNMCDEKWAMDNYFVSDSAGTIITRYGNVMMVKKTVATELTFRSYPLSSNMNRSLLVAEFLTSIGSVAIGTVHLESLNNSDYRTKQLSRCFQILSPADHQILVGDFNFTDDTTLYPNEIACLARKSVYRDVGSELKRTDPTITNMRYTPMSDPDHVIGRMDRILINSDVIKINDLEYVGNDPININDEIELYPSDHVGLVGFFYLL